MQFTGNTDFMGAHFTGKAEFGEAQFMNEVGFCLTQFTERANFIKARFTAKAYSDGFITGCTQVGNTQVFYQALVDSSILNAKNTADSGADSDSNTADASNTTGSSG